VSSPAPATTASTRVFLSMGKDNKPYPLKENMKEILYCNRRTFIFEKIH
jgi:hypothetical protein